MVAPGVSPPAPTATSSAHPPSPVLGISGVALLAPSSESGVKSGIGVMAGGGCWRAVWGMSTSEDSVVGVDVKHGFLSASLVVCGASGLFRVVSAGLVGGLCCCGPCGGGEL